MTDVPRIGNVAGAGGVVHHFADLLFGIAAEDDVHIADVSRIHTDKKIVFVVVIEAKLNRILAVGGDAVLCKLRLRGGINGIANAVYDLLAARSLRSDQILILHPALCHHFLKYKFRHRTAADIAVADEHYSFHL